MYTRKAKHIKKIKISNENDVIKHAPKFVDMHDRCRTVKKIRKYFDIEIENNITHYYIDIFPIYYLGKKIFPNMRDKLIYEKLIPYCKKFNIKNNDVNINEFILYIEDLTGENFSKKRIDLALEIFFNAKWIIVKHNKNIILKRYQYNYIEFI